MNDKLSNNVDRDDETIARKLNQVAEGTRASSQFAADLEERLRDAHRPKTNWFSTRFAQISPTLRWVALMILLALVLSWSIRTLIPAPQPAIDNTPAVPDRSTPTPELINPSVTPATEVSSYDWRSTKLYLAAPLPEYPAQANLYLLKDEQPVTEDVALALANQFGVQGPVYNMPGPLPGATGYLITDGRQRLYVQSNLNFDYYADYTAYAYLSGAGNISAEQAAAAIDVFMKSHGLDFEYQLKYASLNPGLYYALPFTPDGKPVYRDYNIPERLEFTLDENLQAIRVTSYRINYSLTGTYGIRTAQEAFQQILDQSAVIQNGVLETVSSAGNSDGRVWSRSYPDNQRITLYAQVTSNSATEAGGQPLITMGQYTAVGNVSGLENVETGTYVEATGQFSIENGIRTFIVESWKVSTLQETGVSGTLRFEGDRTILTADDGSGEYAIVDAPSDLPLNTTAGEDYLVVYGMMLNNKLEWTSIQYYPSGSGGGGGGGGGGSGTGFYQLNLSGTPVPFPTPQVPGELSTYTIRQGDTLSKIAQDNGITVDQLAQANNLTDTNIFVGQSLVIPGSGSQPQNPLIGKRFENQRGFFSLNIYRKPDGSQRKVYSFTSREENTVYFLNLEGENLADLEKYHNRPINIWATITSADQFGTLTAKLDRWEVPFPDLQMQILRGTQKTEIVAEQPVELFTTDAGKTYVELYPTGDLSNSILGAPGDGVLHEALAIPDEAYGGYPTIRIFSSSMAVNPKDGQAIELTITANQPNIVDEAQDTGSYVPPELTIETVELVYYVPDPHFGNQNLNTGPRYLQPAWRFYGHYSDGSEVGFLVQALKQEFLLPELDPYSGPG